MAGSAFVFTEGNFEEEVVHAPGVVLVDFWAPWCGPCLKLGPVIDELATELAGKAKIGKLNVDENHKIASQFGISSIPCMILFKGGSVVQKMIGLQPKEAIATAINKALGG
ncbi:MAG: hypothetical protein RLZZ436_3247 [Planctomycetota bacterium]|jgi:thioredoxin 1